MCALPLWRLGSRKYHLYYHGVGEIVAHTHLTRKKAALLATDGNFIDRNAWLEEFFCWEHGKLWLALRRDADGELRATLPTSEDWQRTTGTVHPTCPNPSVSEFTFRMSRRTTGRSTSE